MQNEEFLYKPRATLNEVGLCLLREMMQCVRLTSNSVVGALGFWGGGVVCPSLQCAVWYVVPVPVPLPLLSMPAYGASLCPCFLASV